MEFPVFLSYAHGDFAAAAEIAERLTTAGIPTWFDRELQAGQRWLTELEERLRAARFVVVLVSPASAASEFVKKEVLFAHGHKKTLIPLVIRETPDWLLLADIQWLKVVQGRDYLPALLAALGHGPTPSAEPAATLPDRFEALIDENTREFVGRVTDIEAVRRWVSENPCGFRLVLGHPGVGKSALVSILSQIGAGRMPTDPALASLLSGEAWPNWPNVAVVPYFIKRGEDTTSPTKFLGTLLEQLGRRYGLAFTTWGTAAELAAKLQDQLRAISRLLQARGGKLLLLLIDGLDEALAAQGEAAAGDSLLRHLPRDVPPGVFVLMCGRPSAEIDLLRGMLHREKVSVDELGGLSESDVQALLRRGVGEQVLDAKYVRQVWERSEGHPLYVKLLAKELGRGGVRMNDPGGLPANLDALYRSLIARVLQGDTGPVIRTLITFALAREQLTAEQLAGMTNQEVPAAVRAIDTCLEVLTERRGLDGRPIYRIFHDSFADFLRRQSDYAGLVPEATGRILGYVAAGDQGARRAVDRLLNPAPLEAADATDLSRLIEHAARLLTTTHLVEQALARRPAKELAPLLATLARCGEAATAQMVIQGLAAAAERDPAAVGAVLPTLIERPLRGRDVATIQANQQAARVAIEVAVAVCRLGPLAETVRRVLLAGCAAKDPTIRSLTVVGVFRIVREQPRLGMEVVRELGRRSVWFGIIRPRRLEVFAGCALGLFYDRIQDPGLVAELRDIARRLIDRVWGLRLAVWLAPKVMSVLWSSVPDELNSVNLPEIRMYKRFAARNSEFVAEAVRMADWIDPTHGSPTEFVQRLHERARDPGPPEAHLALFTYANAAMSRAITGDDAALEASYETFRLLPPDHQWRQEFMFRMRIIQVGYQISGKPPLSSIWTERVEEATRRFIFDFRGMYSAYYPGYLLGGAVCGVVFVANQLGDGRIRLLDEFVAWAASGPEGMLRWPDRERDHQADALLVLLLEMTGIQYGRVDLPARAAVFHGVAGLLAHAPKFDEFLWDRLATVVARLRVYIPEDVTAFLRQMPREYRDKLQVRMNRIPLRESIGSLVHLSSERFHATVLAAPPERDGARRVWQDFLRVFVGPQSLSATLRYGAHKILGLIRRPPPVPRRPSSE